MATNQTGGVKVRIESLDSIAWIGIVAAIVSGAVHLFLGLRMFPSGMGISFILAGLGFLGAITLVLIGYYRRLVYAVGIPFVLVQIGLWYVFNFMNGPKVFPADIGTIGAIDKIAQLVLLGVLVALLRS